MTQPTGYSVSGIAFSVPLPSCADCGAPFHSLADAFCWSCGGPGPARAAATPPSPPGPPTGPRPLDAIARDVAAAVRVTGHCLLPPPGTTLRGLLEELVETVQT